MSPLVFILLLRLLSHDADMKTDLDSFTSSVLYAYLRSLRPPRDAFTPLYIPLLNVPEADIQLRPEFIKLFHHANISASHLITLDDLPPPSRLEDQLPPANTQWVLVDHNSLQGNLGTIYSSRVHGVIDHHVEEHAVPEDTTSEPRVLEKSGSCSSLVVRTFQSTWDALSSPSLSSGAAHAQSSDSITDDSVVAQGWDAQVAKLVLGSILEDTSNLTSESKTMPVDREVVRYLEAKIQMSAKDARIWNRDKFYKEIARAKKDIEELPLDGILRKDYKQWTENETRLGMSTVVKPLEFIAKKAAAERPEADKGDAFSSAIQSFISVRDLSIYAIMTTSKTAEGQFQRQLFLQARAAAIAPADRFTKNAAAELGLEDLMIEGIADEKTAARNAGEKLYQRVWQQKAIDRSRKQVGPMIREAIK